jgi:putative peptide zinc metalloprotease protein
VTPSGRLIHPDEIDATFAPITGAWVTAVELDGESVLYDETSGGLHQLDALATVVWDRLDGTATLDDLAADLSQTFAADPDRVRRDLVTFVRQLGRQHLLEGVAPPLDEDDDG